MLLSFGLTLLAGVEVGLIAGVGSSLLLLLYRTSRPHIAVVVQVPGTEHYRNVLRHAVLEQPGIWAKFPEQRHLAGAVFLFKPTRCLLCQPASVWWSVIERWHPDGWALVCS